MDIKKKRICADILDFVLVLIGFVIAILFTTNINTAGVTSCDPDIVTVSRVSYLLYFAFIPFFIGLATYYSLIPNMIGGKTIGMYFFNIKIVENHNNKELSMYKYVYRFKTILFYVLLFIILKVYKEMRFKEVHLIEFRNFIIIAVSILTVVFAILHIINVYFGFGERSITDTIYGTKVIHSTKSREKITEEAIYDTDK